eukprot:XP_001195375.3 PREDICTED: uncharacterized protein LOC756494 [Strongylocentrotus purpuratus]
MALAQQSLARVSTVFKRCRLHMFGRTTNPTYLMRCCHHHLGNPLGRRRNDSVTPWELSSLDVKSSMEYFYSTVFHQRSGAASGCLQMSQRQASQVSQPPWQVMPFGKLDQPKKKDFKEPTSSSAVSVLDLDGHAMSYLERLHDAETPPEVLAVLQEGRNDLSIVHYSRALGRLADIYRDKKQEEGLVRSNMAPVLYDSRFRHLCHVVLRQSRHLENDLYLDTLKALQRLKIPLKSSMMYTFLVQAEQRVNTFNAAELAQFAGILSLYDHKNPRVQALVDAVGILIPRHINDLRTFHHTLILIKVVGTSLDGVSRGKLANLLLAILAADEERSLENITQAVLALHQMDYKIDILLELACPVLTQNMKDLSDSDLHNLLCAFSGLCHADQDFFEAASERILEDIDKWSSPWLINVAEAFSVVEIKAPFLLDRIIRRVMDNGVREISLMDMTKLICSLNALGHRPPSSWDFENFVTMATRSLVSDTSRLSSADCRTVLSLAHSLASLGYFPADLWEFITSRKFANCFMMVKDVKEYKKMISDIKILTQQLKDSHQDTAAMWADSIQKLLPLQ